MDTRRALVRAHGLGSIHSFTHSLNGSWGPCCAQHQPGPGISRNCGDKGSRPHGARIITGQSRVHGRGREATSGGIQQGVRVGKASDKEMLEQRLKDLREDSQIQGTHAGPGGEGARPGRRRSQEQRGDCTFGSRGRAVVPRKKGQGHHNRHGHMGHWAGGGQEHLEARWALGQRGLSGGGDGEPREMNPKERWGQAGPST